MLKLALSRARDRVFNKMPIRLLAFDPDGSGIELVERSEILALISSKMIAEFYAKYGFDDSFPWNVPATNTQMFEIAVRNLVTRHAHYAILSHTWLHNKPGEVTHAHWTSGKFDVHSLGYQKLVNFCGVAAMNYGATFGWMDTICINKESSTELDESIRSMFKWYRDAAVCIAYLANTTNLQHMHKDTWFTRGWTLQEMLAPGKRIKFYGSNWCKIAGDQEVDTENTLILDQIQLATTITLRELKGIPYLTCISRKMQWAANRHVTREEDAAYSLMGIFDVNMSIAYGEGSARAFARLAKEILMKPTPHILDIFNWGSGSEYIYRGVTGSSMIPISPKQYCYGTEAPIFWPTQHIPINLTNLGLCLPVLIMRAVRSEGTALANPIGNYYASITITTLKSPLNSSLSMPLSGSLLHFNILDKASPTPTGFGGVPRQTSHDQTFFGVLNFGEDAENIFIPKHNICFAVCLYSNGTFDTGNFERIQTSKAITFPLRQVREWNGPIQKSELTRHGMQLVTMYL